MYSYCILLNMQCETMHFNYLVVNGRLIILRSCRPPRVRFVARGERCASVIVLNLGQWLVILKVNRANKIGHFKIDMSHQKLLFGLSRRKLWWCYFRCVTSHIVIIKFTQKNNDNRSCVEILMFNVKKQDRCVKFLLIVYIFIKFVNNINLKRHDR